MNLELLPHDDLALDLVLRKDGTLCATNSASEIGGCRAIIGFVHGRGRLWRGRRWFRIDLWPSEVEGPIWFLIGGQRAEWRHDGAIYHFGRWFQALRLWPRNEGTRHIIVRERY